MSVFSVVSDWRLDLHPGLSFYQDSDLGWRYDFLFRNLAFFYPLRLSHRFFHYLSFYPGFSLADCFRQFCLLQIECRTGQRSFYAWAGSTVSLFLLTLWISVTRILPWVQKQPFRFAATTRVLQWCPISFL